MNAMNAPGILCRKYNNEIESVEHRAKYAFRLSSSSSFWSTKIYDFIVFDRKIYDIVVFTMAPYAPCDAHMKLQFNL